MSKNVVLTLESRFMDEYGECANLPVFNAHGSIVGYVGGEVPESGNPCEFNRLDDEGFTYCASATEVVRLKAENAKLQASNEVIAEDHAALCEQNVKLRELVQYIYDECYGDDWFNEQAETLGFEQNF